MPTLLGFSRFAALLEEQISDKLISWRPKRFKLLTPRWRSPSDAVLVGPQAAALVSPQNRSYAVRTASLP